VLQAADILVHQATHVPVGDDQSQHLEFSRNCAVGFNSIYGKVLTEPKTILSAAKRVMSLTQPTKKMSKSDKNIKSRILITDSKDAVDKKIKAAVTDSIDGVTFDPEKRPEIANLINIMHYLLGGEMSQSEIAKDVDSKAALKSEAARIINDHLEPIREKFEELMSPDEKSYLIDVAEEGAEMAIANAEVTMRKVRDAMGFGGI